MPELWLSMEVEHEIPINASPEVVWTVTVDVEQWPAWTPTVISVKRLDRGAFGLGSVALIKQPLQPQAEWMVTEFVHGERFSWASHRRGMRLFGTHEIFASGAGARSRLRVRADGVLAMLMWPLLKLAIRHALTQENHGLKTRCEQMSPRDVSGRQPSVQG